MERFLWLLTYIPARVLVFLLAIGDFFAYAIMDLEYHIGEWVIKHTTYVYVIITLIVICSIILAIIGGRLGYQYVELQRSRHWHYRATSYEGHSDRLNNTLYWAGKFFLIPIILVMLVFFIVGCVYLLTNV